MKRILKATLAAILSTVSFMLFVIVITILFEFPLWRNLTYPFRVMRGSERFVGETLNAEVANIWLKAILPVVLS